MQKPDRMQIKDWLIRKTAEQLGISESLAETVIGDSYRNANKAARTVSEIEISGFGTFMVSQSKIRRKIEYFEKSADETKTKELTEKNIERLNYYTTILEELRRRQK